MNARTRKAIGTLAILVFVIAYMAVVSTLGDHVPKAWWCQLAYYLVAGTAWGLPIIPLISWMHRGR
jgi:hypothetical protein